MDGITYYCPRIAAAVAVDAIDGNSCKTTHLLLH